RFNLRPELEAPKNAYVPLAALQERLGLPGQVNALFAAGDGQALQRALREQLKLADWGLVLRSPASPARDLVARYDTDQDGKLESFEWRGSRSKGRWMPKYAWLLEEGLRPADPRLRTEADFRAAFVRRHPYLSLESKQLLLAPPIVAAAER